MNDMLSPPRGFCLVRYSSTDRYRGLDREPFEPTIVDEELSGDVDTQVSVAEIWSLYPPGWRRDAYRIFEKNRAGAPAHKLPLVSSLDSAAQILRILPMTEGPVEVLECIVDCAHLDAESRTCGTGDHLGFDAVYPSGDYYSAVKNGLHVNPHPILQSDYSRSLNQHGLFGTAQDVQRYLSHFRRSVPTESESEFIIVGLWKPSMS